MSYVQKYGKVFGTYQFLTPVLNVACKDCLKRIMLKDFDSFPQRHEDGTQAHPITKLFMTVVNGEEWESQRATVTPCFSPAKIKQMFTCMKPCTKSLDRAMERALENGPSEVDARPLYSRYSVDVISLCCFGTETDCHDNKDNIFFKHAAQMFQVKLYHILTTLLYPVWFKNLLQYTFCNLEALQFFSNVVTEVMRRRRADSGQCQGDFLQALILAGQDDDGRRVGSKVKQLTDDRIIANSIIFLGAGNETTGSLMAFIAYNLATNPEVQEKLYEEIFEAMGETKGDIDKLEYEKVTKVKYLSCFLKEVLRLHTPIPRMQRVAWKNYKLRCEHGRHVEEIFVRKGSTVSLAFSALHRDSDSVSRLKSSRTFRSGKDNDPASE